MYTFACRDVGVDCGFVAEGNTADEAKQAAFAHAAVAHADMMKAMSPDQLSQLEQAVEANTKQV
jgi:predicted small metal-binding protein